MAKSKAGGGPASRQVVRPLVKTGTPSRGVNAGEISQLGTALGNHATDKGNAKMKPRGATESIYGGKAPSQRLCRWATPPPSPQAKVLAQA